MIKNGLLYRAKTEGDGRKDKGKKLEVVEMNGIRKSLRISRKHRISNKGLKEMRVTHN